MITIVKMAGLRCSFKYAKPCVSCLTFMTFEWLALRFLPFASDPIMFNEVNSLSLSLKWSALEASLSAFLEDEWHQCAYKPQPACIGNYSEWQSILFHLTTVRVCQIVWYRITGWSDDNYFEGMWVEAVVAQCELFSWLSLGHTGKTTKNFGQYSRSRSGDDDRASLQNVDFTVFDFLYI